MAVIYRSPHQLFAGVDLSQSQTSVQTDKIGAMLAYSVVFQAYNPSSLSGSLNLQGTNDPRGGDPGTAANAAWFTEKTTSLSTVSSTTIYCVTSTTPYRYMQLVWSWSSGSGTGYAWFYGVDT